jgi:hypothetical protein
VKVQRNRPGCNALTRFHANALQGRLARPSATQCNMTNPQPSASEWIGRPLWVRWTRSATHFSEVNAMLPDS